MSRKFLTALDLAKNELQNAVVQNLAAAPSSPVKFQIYGNTSDNTLYWWDGAQWIAAKAAAGATPAATVTTQAVGDAPVVGVSTNFAREDHKHGREAFANPTATTTFGLAAVNGSAATLARSDHTHGTPTHDNAAHSAINLSALAVPTADVGWGGFKITNLGTPTANADAATKLYVDGLIDGLSWKDAVRVGTTANIALTGGQTVDGVTLANLDRVLVKNQTAPAENGIYSVNTGGAWTRANDMSSAGEVPNATCFVMEGTTLADTAWTCTTSSPITLGTTSITWAQFGAGATYLAGSGLTLTGNTFDVGAGTGITVAADTVALDTTYADGRYINNSGSETLAGDLTINKAVGTGLQVIGGADFVVSGGGDIFVGTGGGGLAVQAGGTATWSDAPTVGNHLTNKTYVDAQVAAVTKRFAANVGGATSQAVTHNLNTRDVVVNVYRMAAPYDTVECDVERTDTNNVTVRFTTAPAANEYRCVVLA
jgi:hypothetical protein